jgi:cytochrome P450
MRWEQFIPRNSSFFVSDGSGTMIEAGSETTSQILNNTIVGLLSNPVTIERCHEELDRVIGTDRTPTIDDVKDLPYIRSLVKVNSTRLS